jgi:hypothetical protein
MAARCSAATSSRRLIVPRSIFLPIASRETANSDASPCPCAMIRFGRSDSRISLPASGPTKESR